MMTKNEWIGLIVYACVIVILCLVFSDWQILIAIGGIMHSCWHGCCDWSEVRWHSRSRNQQYGS